MKKAFKSKLSLLLSLALASAVIYVLLVYATPEPSAESHRLNDTDVTVYEEHAVGLKVRNLCGKDMFIPAKSSEEWLDFNSSALSCVTIERDFVDCGPMISTASCAGSIINQPLADQGSAASCKNWCENELEGVCCDFDATKFIDCDIRSGKGTLFSLSSSAANCTDYD
jgi:hypothetical protein